MASTSDGGKEGYVKRSASDSQDAQGEYRRWKRWTRAYLTAQKARGVPEEALLDETALRAFDSVAMDDIETAGVQQVIYEVLDNRFPEEASHDRIEEVLDNIFDLQVERGETTAVFTGKAKSAFSAAEAEGVKFPDVAKGYLLMRSARLSAEKQWCLEAVLRRSRRCGGVEDHIPGRALCWKHCSACSASGD